MKKIISTLLVAVVLLNFIFCNRVEATDTMLEDDIVSNTISGKDLESLINESKTSFVGQETKIDFAGLGGPLAYGTIANLLARFFNIFPYLIEGMMAICIGGQWFTIEKAVFNEISLFDINYFHLNSSNGIGVSIKNSVARMYYILRLIAMAISLVILIYVGIRMAISTISADKAKYKRMLISWVESIILLFVMHYIISLFINMGSIFSNLITNMRDSLNANGDLSFEAETLAMMESFLGLFTGWSYVQYSLVFWLLIYIQTKFFFMYFKRVVVVGFLILISPIITITYPIDKIGDGKAQAYTVWSHELIVNIAIQPIQALIYLVFMYTAGEIASVSVWVALAFLLALTKVDKIILRLFNLRNVTSLKPVDEQRKD